MNAYTSTSKHNDRFGRLLDDVFASVEGEVRQAAAYVDQVMLPEVRREAGSAARILAGHLQRLADRLHPINQADQAAQAGRSYRNRGL
jgi:hypothetical protein